jgi:hypothetical protein
MEQFYFCAALISRDFEEISNTNFDGKREKWLGLLGVTKKSREGQGIILQPCQWPKAGERVTEYALP